MSDWTGFTAEAEGLSDRHAGKAPCGVGRLLDSLDADERREVRQALRRSELTGAALAIAIRKRVGSAAPSEYTIRRHRRGVCRCPQEGSTDE